MLAVVPVAAVLVDVVQVAYLVVPGSGVCRCWLVPGPATALCGDGGSPAPCPQSPDRHAAAHLHRDRDNMHHYIYIDFNVIRANRLADSRLP